METNDTPIDADELLAALNELLEAERAGVRVALAGRKAASTETMDAFMTRLRDDEARWCAMLAGQIERLGGSASSKCGAFYDKVMALDGTVERLSLLNRGQGWVVRRLEALIPRIADEALRADLREMADSHVENIAATDQVILEIGSGAR